MAVTLFHGIQAYNGKTADLFSLIRRAEFAANCGAAEICGADKPIGVMGLVVVGEAVRLTEIDCWSSIMNGGRRDCSSDQAVYQRFEDGWLLRAAREKSVVMGDEITQDDVRDFAASRANTNFAGTFKDYCEAHLRNTEPVAFWVAEDATELQKKTARIIARKLGLLLFVGTNNIDAWVI